MKVTPLHEYPGKGRATGGVRCHRFLKGEDMLVMAWAGPHPGGGRDRHRRSGPAAGPGRKRDGSGTALGRQIAVLGFGPGGVARKVLARRFWRTGA